MTGDLTAGSERPIDLVRGTRDWLPADCARWARLEALLLDRFALAGYDLLRTPVLEFTELHERKSGAGIVAKLFELSGAGGQGGICLRPELTAGIVRAYTAAEPAPGLPWRVSHSGPVFRYETPRPDRLREFEQVGVERIGDDGPIADAEVVALADWAATEAGVVDTTIRIGHVGLILELLERSGLPAPTRSALTEMLSEAATEGHNVRSLERGIEQLEGWLQTAEAPEPPATVGPIDDSGIDRLFRTLVPVVIGRRSGVEIMHRLRRKWDLGHDMLGVLDRVRGQLHALADLNGSPAVVLDRLRADYSAIAPDSIAALDALTRALADFGIDLERVALDLGFGRGIGFYSRMVFEVVAATPAGPMEVCGGGRYDGLARVLGSARDDRGVGFAFGLERLAQVLDAQGRPAPRPALQGCLIAPATPELRAEAITLVRQFRAQGKRAVLGDPKSTSGFATLIIVNHALGHPDSLWEHDLSSADPVTRPRAADD